MNAKAIKTWWIAISLTELISVLISAAFFVFIANRLNADASLLTHIARELVDLMLGFVVEVVVFAVLLKCAYKKPGTRLLSFFFFCGCISIFFKLYSLGTLHIVGQLLENLKATNATFNTSPFAFFFMLKILLIFSIVSQTAWCYFSWRLRTLNKKEQLNQILSSPAYKLVFQEIQTADELGSLNEVYGKSVQNYPEIAWHLKKQYGERKLQLQAR